VGRIVLSIRYLLNCLEHLSTRFPHQPAELADSGAPLLLGAHAQAEILLLPWWDGDEVEAAALEELRAVIPTSGRAAQGMQVASELKADLWKPMAGSH